MIQWGLIPHGRGETIVSILSYKTISAFVVLLTGESREAAYNYPKSEKTFWANIVNFRDAIRWLTVGYV